MRAQGTTLWLMADDPEPLRHLIAALAQRLGTPAFEPHVTLLGGLSQDPAEIIAVAARLAAATRPLVPRVAGLDGRDEYFRCLILALQPDAALTDLHARAQVAFGPSAAYEPHASLVYGTLDAGTKLSLRSELQDKTPTSLRLTSLQVVGTEGVVSDWRVLAGFPLSRAD